MKAELIKELHGLGVFRDPRTKQKLECMKATGVLEVLNWVKEEMETFASEVREGRKQGNFLFLVTDEIMDEIRITNKKCIPLQFRKFEVMLISEYKEKILPYLR